MSGLPESRHINKAILFHSNDILNLFLLQMLTSARQMPIIVMRMLRVQIQMVVSRVLATMVTLGMESTARVSYMT